MAEAWFTTRSIGPGVWVIQEPIGRIAPHFDVTVVNMYLVEGSDRAALIDSGMGIGDIAEVCRTLTDKPVINICTHGHWDHVGGTHRFAERLIHTAEAARLTQSYDVGQITRIEVAPATGELADGMQIDLGGRTLTVWHTPGHSPGHVSLLDSATGCLFCADTCYAGTMWFQTADADVTAWRQSLERIASGPVQFICGGHEEPMQPRDLAARALAGLTTAQAGKSVSEPFAPQAGVLKHKFEGFAMLLKQ